MRPHYYCLPVLKREEHRRALVAAATSGSGRFFLGTDSAPHAAALKEHASGCAGCYTALQRARAVCRGVRRRRRARPARRLRQLPRRRRSTACRATPARSRCSAQPGPLPEALPFGEAELKPLRGGETLAWQLVAERPRMTETTSPRIALLIDADNSPSSKIDVILAELATSATANIRRAYGNWKKHGCKGWEERAARARDPADAAVRLQQGQERDRHGDGHRRDGPALHRRARRRSASSRRDADFTPLVMHLRAKGAAVYGFGAQKTPEPFVNACSRFLYLEKLRSRRARGGVDAGESPRPRAPRRRAAPAPSCARCRARQRCCATRSRRRPGEDGWARARRGRPADRQPGVVRPAQLRLRAR